MCNETSADLFTKPHAGTCWSKVVGPTGPIKEILPMISCLFNIVLGLVGLLLSRNVTEGGKFLYSAQFGYGIAAFFFHITLWEGFYRLLDIQLNFIQAINIVFMACVPREEGVYYNLRFYAITLFFSIYPFFGHVLGITLHESWISWITFDAIWLVVLSGLLVIWFHRKHLVTPGHANRKAVFNLVWNIILSVVVAYVFWLIDEVICVKEGHTSVAIVIFGHSLWHVFIGFAFHYMTTLTVFLRAHNLRMHPKVFIWPKNKPFAIFILVQYEELLYVDCEEMSLAGNIIKAINSRALSVIRYGAGIIEWTKEELKKMDRTTRTLLTISASTQEMEVRRELQSLEDVVEIKKCSLGLPRQTKSF